MLVEMLSQEFMHFAFLAGLIAAVVCPAIGLFLVLRRLGQYGDTLAHISLAGVAAGMLMKVTPVYTGLGFSVGASLLMDWLRTSYKRYSELSVAIMLSASMALAGLLLSANEGAGGQVMGYLFGSLLTVEPGSLKVIGVLGVVVLLLLALLYKELLSVTFDEENARIGGLPVRPVNLLFMVLTAMTVAVAMSVVGVLLISALMVIPVAAALQVARSFRGALLWAVALGVVSVLTGLTMAYMLNLAPGGTVALTAVGLLMVVVVYKRLRGLE